jgi:hypothetical protein
MLLLLGLLGAALGAAFGTIGLAFDLPFPSRHHAGVLAACAAATAGIAALAGWLVPRLVVGPGGAMPAAAGGPAVLAVTTMSALLRLAGSAVVFVVARSLAAPTAQEQPVFTALWTVVAVLLGGALAGLLAAAIALSSRG